jgi:hypothetical protein
MWRIIGENLQTNKRFSSKFTRKCGFTLFSGMLFRINRASTLTLNIK